MSVPGGAQAALRHTLRKSTRIVAIPLSRPIPLPPRAAAASTSDSTLQPGFNTSNRSGHGNGAGALTYYHFQLSSKKKRKEKQKQQEKKEGEGDATPKSRWSLPEGGIVAWAQTKAAETWAGFGKAEGGWKVCVLYLSRSLRITST